MEFNDLVIFKEVYQSGSFSKAAVNLGYVQPNISHRIKSIERQLGLKLFERTNKGIKALPAADQLYVHSQKILTDYHNMIEDLSKYKMIRIGATPTLVYSVIPLFTKRLKDSGYSDVFNSTHATSELFQQLEQDKLDCIWTNREFNKNKYKSLLHVREELFILSNCDWHSLSEVNLVVSSDTSCPYRKELIKIMEDRDYNLVAFDNLGSILNSIKTIQNSITLLPKAMVNTVDHTLHVTFIEKYAEIDLLAKKETLLMI
ncbi:MULTISPECIES: LysR family transcriptional regulator [Sporolactobacillus]|uniref:DNA-binding transcriptional regulator, LysR family n=1 Tax=Sporolactobacillus nakayamae TaxID=269670 RepID=A0A1I2TMW0_9BACL|nr:MULTISPECIES: LysR family transcriptional regulator [Sporolactobacillus]MCQ2010212.1 LysR family transcriptional regulator [Sporolactobacillus sp. STSJ-5]SFG66252.1 DNA-binding transcriptional regulator, LysR family [Sporolactobacillus nakayamae]